LATDCDEIERLLDGSGGIHRVARDHRLNDDRIIATNDDAAARGMPTTTWRVWRRAK